MLQMETSPGTPHPLARGSERARSRDSARMGVGGGSTAWMKVLCTENPRLSSVDGVSGRGAHCRAAAGAAAMSPVEGAAARAASHFTASDLCASNGVALVAPNRRGKDIPSTAKELGEGVEGYGIGVGGYCGVLTGVNIGAMDDAGSVAGLKVSLPAAVDGASAMSSKQSGTGRHRRWGSEASTADGQMLSQRLMRLRGRTGCSTWPACCSRTSQMSLRRASCSSSDNFA
mmetsp:Transcript_77373/g.224484  ORF Transcript_77373/g.224484 Transcript_77373/m.224484 type:complete len:230 (-) Transcript_77373:927-1616(-)